MCVVELEDVIDLYLLFLYDVLVMWVGWLEFVCVVIYKYDIGWLVIDILFKWLVIEDENDNVYVD